MTNPIVLAYTNALRAMEGGAPKNLIRRALLEAEEIDPNLDASEEKLREHIAGSEVNDRLHLDLHLALIKWDNASVAGNEWTNGTQPNTDERRSLVIKALGLDDSTKDVFDKQFPPSGGDNTTVIAGPWDPWYTPEVKQQRDFYWRDYLEYLRTQRGWDAEALDNLDTATTHVVERLINPSRKEAGQTKGLVVGYVQSGKTANFTGVIAKAIDAGYRLIIVMTGTTNLLREQTQRRLDMELVGRENILRGANEDDPSAIDRVDYLDDEDWLGGRFVSHGARPSDIGRPDIHRMTTRNFDYRKLQQGLPALEFEREDKSQPLWHKNNLFTSNARLIIVKKNSSVLKNLVKDLKHTADKLEDIPALIIDDESDQASVNTVDQRKWQELWDENKKKRTAINQHISDLLGMLPRVQYVGYTATPFANVFVDPYDAEDIFPKDYLISLPRPDGYMGAEDFHDLDRTIPDEEKTYANSGEKAHVRLVGKGDEEKELQAALDSFVLAGAIKLYREAHGCKEFRHHTMLVHETMRKSGHKANAQDIQAMWQSAGYLSGGAYKRFQDLFVNDFSPVSAALKPDVPTPSLFEEVAKYIGQAARKIAPNANPVLVVNSETDIEQEDLDFDKRPVWRVLIGGNKLARGFTVEGLTVTYYSRGVGHAEALMQMGRWFGFRPGYRDLVRLFVTKKVRDAFEAACRDEEHFRKELRQYADMADGRPTITPEHVQPLVMRHGLRPTAPNKMYNAELVQKRTKTKEPSSGYPSLDDQDALDQNIDACVPLLKAAATLTTLRAGTRSFDALTGTVSHQVMVNVLRSLTWATPDTFAPDLAWIATLSDEVIDHWDVMLPQRKTRKPMNIRGVGMFTVHGRKVEHDISIRGNSESLHRQAIDELPGRTARSGCVILYPVMSNDDLKKNDIADDGYPKRLVMALMLQLPDAAIPDDHRPLVYRVKSPDKPHYAIVDR
ncbi:Z1 domain-containing protein [Kutzneria albida]|uniref:Putative endonuclease Z1 domain-containing protein n=1 Tax=Kutzneria albida DSM 43870 TaxID=1449976 RepID=W5WS54_9PSEU|nr:Z1 domain-containing protein [Kutzneria albida]AHI01000.1 hypothetical protein KALB_7642 [Kutzneria albida DSM 43870]